MNTFIELIVREKSCGDFRGYVRCRDVKNELWELRGAYAECVVNAAQNAMQCFLDVDNWDLYGCIE